MKVEMEMEEKRVMEENQEPMEVMQVMEKEERMKAEHWGEMS